MVGWIESSSTKFWIEFEAELEFMTIMYLKDVNKMIRRRPGTSYNDGIGRQKLQSV